MNRSSYLFGVVAIAQWLTGAAQADDSAVILMYHHVDTGTPRATSVTPERFEAHMRHLERGGFSVLALGEVLQSLERGDPLPERSVVITFDDGYTSVLSQALPRLRARGWPFTVFVSTQYIDDGYGGYLSWDDLRTLVAHGATVGNHTRSHAHLLRRRPSESAERWRARVRGEITDAAARIRDEIGTAALDVLAYPYGEFDADVAAIVAELGLTALGQHSGAVGTGTDLQAMPRFPMAVGFDADEDFALRVRTRPLPAKLAGDRIVTAGARPVLELTLAEGDYRIDQLACFASLQGRMTLTRVGETAFEAAPTRGLVPGRTKYNCTAPSASEFGVYYWASHLLMVKTAQGEWYEE